MGSTGRRVSWRRAKGIRARRATGKSRNRHEPAIAPRFSMQDDLWWENWLLEAWKMIEIGPDAAAHSACNIIFGRARHIWWHANSGAALCDHAYLNCIIIGTQ